MKRLVHNIIRIFVILTFVVSQLSLMLIGLGVASAAPAQETIPTNPSAFAIDISNVSINGGGNAAKLAPGSVFSLSLDYSIVELNESRPFCIDQIVIGYSHAIQPEDCAYNGIPGFGGVSGSSTLNLTAPSTPGIYLAVSIPGIA